MKRTEIQLKENMMNILPFVLVLAVPVFANGQDAPHCPMMQDKADPHAAAVDARGDHAMGFSHAKSAHHFQLSPDGGAIEVGAKDEKDEGTRDEIRMHLAHIAQMFSAGNFQVPMFIHDTVPPGVAVMEAKKEAISYKYEETAKGGRIRITTTDADALKAVHDFLSFQIDDHRTGDPKAISPIKGSDQK